MNEKLYMYDIVTSNAAFIANLNNLLYCAGKGVG